MIGMSNVQLRQMKIAKGMCTIKRYEHKTEIEIDYKIKR